MEIGWRAWTNLLQICRRWSAHRWTHERGGIRQICRFPDGGDERAWRCPVATSRCKARLADPVITFGKFAEGQSLAPPEGKSCQLARFQRWSAASPVATACPRGANLHLCVCCRKSAHGRISCVSDSGRAWFRRSSAANGALGSTRHANLHIGDRCRRGPQGGCAKLRILVQMAN